jgi:hypothetical protein
VALQKPLAYLTAVCCGCRDAALPELELRLRQRSELLRALITAVGTLAHTGAAAQRGAGDCVAAAGDLGSAFARLGAYEDAAAHREAGHAAAAFGAACLGVAEGCAASVGASGEETRVRRRPMPVYVAIVLLCARLRACQRTRTQRRTARRASAVGAFRAACLGVAEGCAASRRQCDFAQCQRGWLANSATCLACGVLCSARGLVSHALRGHCFDADACTTSIRFAGDHPRVRAACSSCSCSCRCTSIMHVSSDRTVLVPVMVRTLLSDGDIIAKPANLDKTVMRFLCKYSDIPLEDCHLTDNIIVSRLLACSQRRQ